ARRPRCALRHLAVPWLAVALLATAWPASAQMTSVTLGSAWMRPARAGQDSARTYVDIGSDQPLTLTEVTTPDARSVEFVRVAPGGSAADEVIVAALPVTPGTPTRLAFRGSHLRLVGINRDLPQRGTRAGDPALRRQPWPCDPCLR
ncbi:MAG: copper chaperone PCu(A)C, partial [Casimicrobiaceae bacterium]